MPYHGCYPSKYIDKVINQCRAHHAPLQWDDFTIPDQLLVSLPTSQSSTLLRLPPELLSFIFEYADPLGKVCLALTCKHLLRASCLADMKIPSAVQHRQLCSPDCLAMRSLVHLVVPVNRRGGPPGGALAVCSYCYRYRPTREDYWTPVRAKVLGDRWLPNLVNSWIWYWGHHGSLQCQECSLEEHCAGEDSSGNGKVGK
ncbi:hypothetical protein HD806DRAFT_513620 [Xylariaceae sp. AK1471]|nr:hypothetical protein HD806DRAFT_513620 [Xylariaceae sp. AK1471]